LRLSGIVARLTVANALAAAAGLITGPLLARALGASGRGDLAAILVPFSLAPSVLSLGIPAFAYCELPRGRAVDEVIGSLGLPLLALGVAAAVAAVPVADALAGGRETVRLFLIIGFLCMPILMVAGLVSSSLGALERWRRVVATRLIPFAVAFAAIAVLSAVGRLTVATAAAFTLLGALLSLLPGLSLLTERGRPVFRLALAREGVGFGLKSWVGALALMANARLDQLLMITAVAPRELGLYAVATTLAGASGLATGALSPPLMARVAAGQTHLLPQALRITLAATVALNVALGLATPTLLPALFGPEFREAVAMAIVLLAAGVPFAGASVLSSALQADGAPLIPSLGEGIALVITVAGLATLLGPLGGLGAAIVSLAAYSASFTFQLIMARRRIAAPLSAYLLASRIDLRWARNLLTHPSHEVNAAV
jgi:O-antigen/teichoic acid export membrane protein